MPAQIGRQNADPVQRSWPRANNAQYGGSFSLAASLGVAELLDRQRRHADRPIA